MPAVSRRKAPSLTAIQTGNQLNWGEMNKVLVISLAVLALLAAIVAIIVWRAIQEPVVATPGPYEVGRQHLHDQFEAAKKREAQFEQQDWDSITLLHNLIVAHQQRIDKLAGNKEAAEIVAYDHDAMIRLQKRINDLDAKQRAQWLEKSESAAPQAAKPEPTPVHQP